MNAKKKLLATILYFILLLGFCNMTKAQEVSLKNKIGQMLIIGFKGTHLTPNDAIVHAILEQQIGGVILFDYDFQTKTFEHNIKNPTQLQKLTKSLQQYATEAAKIHLNNVTPLFISIDYEGGKVNRLKEEYGFSKTVSAWEIGQMSEEEITQHALQMAKTLNDAGINVNFAPVIDVNVNRDNPVIGKLNRSFSADPKKVSQYAAIFSNVYKDHGILCAYKHFPGHGSSTADTHFGFVDITSTWQKYELEPYQRLLSQSYRCPMVMMAHVLHYGLDPLGFPASLSHNIITNLLRNQLNFNGVIVTDDLQMKAIADHYGIEEAVRLAINAGADILIFANQLAKTPVDPAQIIAMIYEAVQQGKIAESRINEAYQRIIQLKNRYQSSAIIK